MNETIVIGHRNPDTDAICSAIGYADFKTKIGMEGVFPARCGETNARIDFVLETFGMPKPRLIMDVSPKIEDVMQPNVVFVHPCSTIAEALDQMEMRGIRVLPIQDEQRQCLGLVSIFKASRFFFPSASRVRDTRNIQTTIKNLVRSLRGDLLVGESSDEEKELTLMVAAMTLGEFYNRINNYTGNNLVVITGDREEIQSTAIYSEVDTLIVTGGFQMAPKLLDLARDAGVNVIVSPHDTVTTAALCRGAMEVRHAMDSEFTAFQKSDRLSRVRDTAARSTQSGFPVLDDSGRMTGFLTKTDFLKKVDRRLILVDHNEWSQAVAGAQELPVMEIIDHHRIGNLSTRDPILVRNEPVGSTSTIVAECFFERDVPLEPSIAGLLLAGLVTDTLNLSSPTTTQRDATVLRKLETIANIDATRFIEQVFASGSILVTREPADAITADCKEYEEEAERFSVAQIEELGFTEFLNRKAEIQNALGAYRAKNGYLFSALMVTDVVQNNSLLLLSLDDRFEPEVTYPEFDDDVFEMRGVVSRKKQLIPFLTDLIRQTPLTP